MSGHIFKTVQFKLGGKSEQPSSPPHPALGFGGVAVDEAQRASGLPVISLESSSSVVGGGELNAKR